jgi:hypothetical protein
VLVDLFTAGWRSVDERIARIEELLGGDERVDVIGLPGSEQDALSAEVKAPAEVKLPQADAA